MTTIDLIDLALFILSAIGVFIVIPVLIWYDNK